MANHSDNQLTPEQARELARRNQVGDARSKWGGVERHLDMFSSMDAPGSIVEVSLDEFPDSQKEYLRTSSNQDRIDRYAAQDIDTPITITRYKRPNRDGWKWYVMDGGHRFSAAVAKGKKSIKALVLGEMVNESLLLEMSKDEYHLQSKFSHFNNLLFDGKLPDIPLKWSNRRTGVMGGVCRATVDTKTHKVDVKEIEISSLWREAGTEEEIDGLLIHEMIHAWCFLNISYTVLRIAGGHGTFFMTKREECQSKTPIPIPVSEELPKDYMDRVNQAVAKKVAGKTIDVLVFDRKHGTFACVYREGILEANEAVARVKYAPMLSDTTVTAYQLKSPKGMFLDLPLGRVFKKFSWEDTRYKLDDNAIQDLKDAKVLYRIGIQEQATNEPKEEKPENLNEATNPLVMFNQLSSKLQDFIFGKQPDLEDVQRSLNDLHPVRGHVWIEDLVGNSPIDPFRYRIFTKRIALVKKEAQRKSIQSAERSGDVRMVLYPIRTDSGNKVMWRAFDKDGKQVGNPRPTTLRVALKNSLIWAGLMKDQQLVGDWVELKNK